MENKERQFKEPTPQIDKEALKEFVKYNSIEEEDLGLVHKLATFPTQLIVMELHNVFNTPSEDATGRQLENRIQEAPDEKTKALIETILEFYKKYGSRASFSLVRFLEGEY